MRWQLSVNLRYCYLFRRATQNKSASWNSPTIVINLIVLPLSPVTVSQHYLPRSLRSIVTCGKTPTTVTWTASSNICCHVVVTQQRPIESFATCPRRKRSEFSELQAHHCMTPEQWTWLLCSGSVISANELLLQELTQLIRIKMLISRFLEIFAS